MMTIHKDLKNQIRDRMEKTGERSAWLNGFKPG